MTKRPVEEVRKTGWFVALAALLAGATGWVVFDELVTRRPWIQFRAEYNRLAENRGASPVPVRIDQVVQPELGTIDRCTTCHAGIDDPAFDDAAVPQPYRAHPRRTELLGPHPPPTFGCTVCHQGQGMQTKGVAGAEFRHGLDDPYWEAPLLSGAAVESTCVRCHEPDQAAEVASVFGQGRRWYEDLGCGGCHESRLVERTGTMAPPLNWSRVKQSPDFLVQWIRAPHAIRPRTRMPDSWPSGSGSAVAEAEARRDVQARREEPVAIAAYLGSLAGPALPRARVAGDPERGAALYRALGCPACHEAADDRRPLGPELLRVGEKASRDWLHAWLAGPKAMWAGARMPDFRLTEEERNHLVAYLVQQRDPGRPAARGVDAEWSADPALIDQGRRLVLKYGCFGCHSVEGFDDAGRAGPTLTGYGDKAPDQLDWGRASPHRPYLLEWTRLKIAEPRAMDREGVELVMPRHQLTPEQIEALSVFVLAERTWPQAPSFVASFAHEDRARARGEHLLARHGCRSCHELGRELVHHRDEEGELLWTDQIPIGGDVRRWYAGPHLAPPSLTFAGLKLRYRWAFDYLRRPVTIRPWLPGRMPTYDLADEEAEALVRDWAFRDQQSYPFRTFDREPMTARDAEDAQWLFEQMQCLKCHPTQPSEGNASEWAPDLALSGQRLSPGWIRQWLLDPQRLQPGTQMPTYFPRLDDDDPDSYTTPYPERLGGDVQRQVDALVQWTLSYGSRTAEPTNEGEDR
jgi:cytochrome c2